MWFDIPTWVKFVLAGILLGVGAWLIFKVDGTLGFLVVMAGMTVLIISGPDNSDKRGYKF